VHSLRRIHFQYLEDKVAGKLIPWVGKLATMAGHSVLIKSVLTSIVIYFITVLEIPKEVLMKNDSIRRALLWAACEKVTRRKCKVNWELVCKPKEYGGLGILNLMKFASALRLRWLWNEWVDDSKPWVGLGNPCTADDHELFATATTVTIGNGDKAIFWESTWLNGMHPKDIAPKIFEIAKRRKCTIKIALENDFWVSHINIQGGLSVEHTMQFYTLWEMVQLIHLDISTTDSIRWKFCNDNTVKEYTASSAYKMQFLGHTCSPMTSMVLETMGYP
jgi:hypothetical protein